MNSKGMEELRRYIHVWRRKLGKNKKKKKYILSCRYIILMSGIGK